MYTHLNATCRTMKRSPLLMRFLPSGWAPESCSARLHTGHAHRWERKMLCSEAPTEPRLSWSRNPSRWTVFLSCQKYCSELFSFASRCALVPAERGCDVMRAELPYTRADARRRNTHLAKEGKTGVGGSQPSVPFHCKSTVSHLDRLHAVLFVF